MFVKSHICYLHCKVLLHPLPDNHIDHFLVSFLLSLSLCDHVGLENLHHHQFSNMKSFFFTLSFPPSHAAFQRCQKSWKSQHPTSLTSLSLHARPLLALHHTIVSEPDPFPVKKSQKLAAGDGLLSSGGVCLTQMLLSVEPLRLEQLPLTLPPPSVKPSVPLRSWGSES